MLRTQISLTQEQRHLLDASAARTGRSISALIRDAVDQIYGSERSAHDDLAIMQQAFGSWTEREVDDATRAEPQRYGSRLAHFAP